MNLSKSIGCLCLGAGLLIGGRPATAESPFTYQGRLLDGGAPANDLYDLEFRLYVTESGGGQVAPPVLKSNVPIAEGLFSADLDFGDAAFDGGARWVEVVVDGTVLGPRQPIHAAPYALFARNAPFRMNGSDIYYSGGGLCLGSDNPDAILAIEDVGAEDGVPMLCFGEDEAAAFTFESGFAGSGASGNFLKLVSQWGEIPMAWWGDGRVGIGTDAPLDDLHIADGDARLRLESDASDTWGSTINLSEAAGGVTTSNWQIRRTTSGSSNSLRFRYDPNGDSNHSTYMTMSEAGNVGIGTTTPDAKLDIYQSAPNQPGVIISKPASNTLDAALLIDSGGSTNANYAALRVEMSGAGSGHAAALWSDLGVSTLQAESDSSNSTFVAAVRGISHNRAIGVLAEASETSDPDAIPLVAEQNGPGDDIAVFRRFITQGSLNVARIDTTGRGYFNGGTQSSGADLAEAFEVEGDVSAYEPGDVLVISTEADRTVTRSAGAYSSLVAGVHATKPGVLLTERDIDQPLDDMVPMGVVGVIPTKVSAENGEIRRGDLLVSASLPGHAMKGTDRSRMIGAIIGKALENFDGSGTGMIKVMVNVK